MARLIPVLRRATELARQGMAFGQAVDEAIYEHQAEVSPDEKRRLTLGAAKACMSGAR